MVTYLLIVTQTFESKPPRFSGVLTFTSLSEAMHVKEMLETDYFQCRIDTHKAF
jgi:hypothetical protein